MNGNGSKLGERSTLQKLPHLSHSRLNRYLHCPEQYRLYYIENLRPRWTAAALVFGKVVHQALAELFRTGADPVATFIAQWDDVKELPLDYGARSSWDKLSITGQNLLAQFVLKELPRLSEVSAIEAPFELNITSLDVPFIGIIDLVAHVDETNTVIDFKTSGSSYGYQEAILSDQLSAYQLAEPTAESAALCVLVKTKEPRIEWLMVQRSADQLTEYLAKAEYVTRAITDEVFYKRPGKWCAWCDFLPVCLGETRKIEETLKQIG